MENGRQFIPLYFDVLGSKLYRSISGNALQLYWMMRRYVCRACSGHSLSLFYTGGALAVSGYLGNYAKIFGVSETTIGRWIRELDGHDVLRIYQRGTDDRPSIWILGKVQHIEGSQWGNELFFLDHLALAQEEDDETVAAFDDDRVEECLGPKLSKLNLTTALLQVQMQVQMQVSNKEEVIDKTNTPPPLKERVRTVYPTKEENWIDTDNNEEYVSLDADGFPTETLHPLIEFIQRKGRNLTQNQRDKLSWGQPKHNPRYPAPTHLFMTNPHFKTFIEEKISWAQGAKGNKRVQTGSLVSAICNYETEKFGWLDWIQAREESTQQHEGPDVITTTPLPPGWEVRLPDVNLTEIWPGAEIVEEGGS